MVENVGEQISMQINKTGYLYPFANTQNDQKRKHRYFNESRV